MMFNIDHNAEITLEQKIDGSLTRALCIHGHFYQPPRENPFSGIIPEEVGAAPYPNWNARIHAECYQPNAELGNFERISFNVGPTFLGGWKISIRLHINGLLPKTGQI